MFECGRYYFGTKKLNAKGNRNSITPIDMLQKKLKEIYFHSKETDQKNPNRNIMKYQEMTNEEALETLSLHHFDAFSRLKYVLEQVFNGNNNSELLVALAASSSLRVHCHLF